MTDWTNRPGGMDERQRLLDYTHSGSDTIKNGRRQAAVLVVLYRGRRGEVRTILTVRSHNLTHHPGEVALPGGKCEPNDSSLIATAYREAEEEIGINKERLELLTILPPLISRSSNFIVSPVIVWYSEDGISSLRNAPDEVTEVFSAPLKKFIIRNTNYTFHVLEDSYPLHCVRHTRFRVMGLTCNVLIQCASIAFALPPEFPFSYPESIAYIEDDKPGVNEKIEILNDYEHG